MNTEQLKRGHRDLALLDAERLTICDMPQDTPEQIARHSDVSAAMDIEMANPGCWRKDH